VNTIQKWSQEMGLDMVEFVMDVEESFKLSIPDSVAQTINTPRKLIDYLHSQLPHTNETHCLSQRAFYAVRCAIGREIGTIHPRVGPATEIASILPPENASAVWEQIGANLNVPEWSKFRGNRLWESVFFHQRPRTVGDVASQIATRWPTLCKSDGEGWSWDEVRIAVDGLMREQLGIREYKLDDCFINDLGVD
jgi:hypothetical protein